MGERTVDELQDLSELSHTRRVRLLMGEGRPHERDGIDVTGRMGRGEVGEARERERRAKSCLMGLKTQQHLGGTKDVVVWAYK